MRKGDWETALSDYLAGAGEYSYGSNDCMLFCAGAVKAQTGQDFARGHRRKYKSAIGAGRYLLSLGFDCPADMIASLLEEKPVAFAQRGDIVLIRDDAGQEIPGVCYGEIALILVEDGLGRVPRDRWLKAWAV